MSQADPVRVGILYSRTGTISTIGHSQWQGAQLAIEEINAAGGLLGRELVGVSLDAASDPARCAGMARQLIEVARVNVIFGCYLSSSRKAVIPVIEKWNKLLFYPTLYEGFEFSGNVIYGGAAPNQNSVPLATFMMANFGPRVYMIGSDYIYPYESNRIMWDLLSQHPDSEKLGEYYLPLEADEADFRQVMQDVAVKRPDFIFSTVVGDSTAALYRAYAEAGFDPKTMPIASLTTSEAEVARMGAAVAAGHFTAAPYFQSIESVANGRCLSRMRARFGADALPNLCWESAYFQVHLFAQAFCLSGSDHIHDLLPYLLGGEFDAPQGRVRIDPVNHHTCLYPRIGRANRQGGFTIVREATRPVVPDPYLVTHACGDWTARLDTLEG